MGVHLSLLSASSPYLQMSLPRPAQPGSSRGQSGKHNPAQQSKATGFSYLSLDKGSAEPVKHGLQRGWSDLRGESQKGSPEHPPLINTRIHPKFCPVFFTSIPTLTLHRPPPLSPKEVSSGGRLEGRISKEVISGLHSASPFTQGPSSSRIRAECKLLHRSPTPHITYRVHAYLRSHLLFRTHFSTLLPSLSFSYGHTQSLLRTVGLGEMLASRGPPSSNLGGGEILLKQWGKCSRSFQAACVYSSFQLQPGLNT